MQEMPMTLSHDEVQRLLSQSRMGGPNPLQEKLNKMTASSAPAVSLAERALNAEIEDAELILPTPKTEVSIAQDPAASPTDSSGQEAASLKTEKKPEITVQIAHGSPIFPTPVVFLGTGSATTNYAAFLKNKFTDAIRRMGNVTPHPTRGFPRPYLDAMHFMRVLVDIKDLLPRHEYVRFNCPVRLLKEIDFDSVLHAFLHENREIIETIAIFVFQKKPATVAPTDDANKTPAQEPPTDAAE